MSAVDSWNIRKSLQLKPEADGGSNRGSIKAALQKKKPRGGETLLDIIRSEEPKQGIGYRNLIEHKGNTAWKSFRDKLRLKRASSAWISAIRTPPPDYSIHRHKQRISRRRRTIRFDTISSLNTVKTPAKMSDEAAPKIPRGGSGRSDPDDVHLGSGKRQPLLRPNSIKTPSSEDGNSHMVGRSSSLRKSPSFTDGRQMSAREAAMQQVAAEAEAAEKAQQEEDEKSSMSLMDLLEETDRAMGFEGTKYRMGEEADEEYSEEDDEEEDGGGGVENNCCVCMVKHRGQAFVPCGHSFCRMCSREMMIQKGTCPLCNNFIVEILEVF